ncbi:MAG: glycosyltransferase family 39 protein [bacterium]|nr:glycosyltransferase family 39 protein [bacterium]
MQPGFNILTVFRNARFYLFLYVIALFLLNYYSKTLFYRPSSMHQWRQTDCLSITKNYYEEGMHFFQPKIHYQGPVDGKAVSEFPILNYTVAALWKVFGEHEFIYRLLEYLIYLTAIFILFGTMLRFYKSRFIAFFTVSILLTSPLLTFYSFNFIADVPALSFGIMSFCFFLTFYFNKKISFFYWAIFCGTLAVLMKASALMGLSLLFFFSVIDLLNLNRIFKTERLFTKKMWPAFTIVLSVTVIVSWYRFALAYNLNNSNNIFLLTVLPIWEMDEAQIIYNLKNLFNNLFPVFLNKPMLFLFLCVVMYVAGRFRQLNVFYRYAFVFTAIYFVFYILFFFQVFGVHDYYLNNLMIFPVITFMSFASIITKTNFLISHRSFVWLFLISLILFNSFHAAAMYRLRMIKDDKMVYWFPFNTEEERNLSQYLFWDYGNAIKKVEGLTPALREHGIQREDFVLSVPDQSFDISLYFMDQKGRTIPRDYFSMDTTIIFSYRHKKIKYFVLSDTTLKAQISFKKFSPYLETFFTSNGVEVFKVKPSFY